MQACRLGTPHERCPPNHPAAGAALAHAGGRAGCAVWTSRAQPAAPGGGRSAAGGTRDRQACTCCSLQRRQACCLCHCTAGGLLGRGAPCVCTVKSAGGMAVRTPAPRQPWAQPQGPHAHAPTNPSPPAPPVLPHTQAWRPPLRPSPFSTRSTAPAACARLLGRGGRRTRAAARAPSPLSSARRVLSLGGGLPGTPGHLMAWGVPCKPAPDGARPAPRIPAAPQVHAAVCALGVPCVLEHSQAGEYSIDVAIPSHKIAGARRACCAVLCSAALCAAAPCHAVLTQPPAPPCDGTVGGSWREPAAAHALPSSCTPTNRRPLFPGPVEVDGPVHFAVNSTHLMGGTALKRRLLRVRRVAAAERMASLLLRPRRFAGRSTKVPAAAPHCPLLPRRAHRCRPPPACSAWDGRRWRCHSTSGGTCRLTSRPPTCGASCRRLGCTFRLGASCQGQPGHSSSGGRSRQSSGRGRGSQWQCGSSEMWRSSQQGRSPRSRPCSHPCSRSSSSALLLSSPPAARQGGNPRRMRVRRA